METPSSYRLAKNPLASKTLWGAALALFSWLNRRYEWGIVEGAVPDFLVFSFTLLLVVWGRYDAKVDIGSFTDPLTPQPKRINR